MFLTASVFPQKHKQYAKNSRNQIMQSYFYPLTHISLDVLNSFISAGEDVPEHRYSEFIYRLVKALGQYLRSDIEWIDL